MMFEELKEELKDYISIYAFDGWVDTTEKNVMDTIDKFFETYQNEGVHQEKSNNSEPLENFK